VSLRGSSGSMLLRRKWRGGRQRLSRLQSNFKLYVPNFSYLACSILMEDLHTAFGNSRRRVSILWPQFIKWPTNIHLTYHFCLMI
jgi:hypothetical protein